MSAALALSLLWILWTADKVWRARATPNTDSFVFGPVPGAYNKIAAVAQASIAVVLLLFVLAFMAERVWPQLSRRY